MNTENINNSAEQNTQTLSGKAILAIVMGGLLAGLSQPFVWPGDPQAQIWDATGLSGLFCFSAAVPALTVLNKVRAKGAYALGLLFCWIQLVVIFYWIVVAMHVFGRLPLTVSLAGLALLGVATGGQVAIAWWMTHRVWRRYPLPLWFVFPLALSGMEYFRNTGLYGGFPWGNLGNSLASVPVFLQAASLFGVYGLVFWIALVNAVIAEMIWWKQGEGSFPKWGCIVAVSLSCLLMVYGALRLNTEVSVDKKIKVGLLQGNIEQGIKNKQRQHRHVILDKYQKLQHKAQAAHVDLIVWPEASLPGSVGAQYTNYQLFGVPAAEPAIQNPAYSLVGAVLMNKSASSDASSKGAYHLYNSAVMLDPSLKVMGRFDKSHLVPFGEYVPWPFHLLVRKIVPNVGRFEPGYGQKPIEIQRGDQSYKIGATVCYEGVFPEISRQLVNDGAELLVNMTNDAWYGFSSAPWQHLYMYRLRSVETGRPFVRATNTGITAWIDPHGFLHEPTALYQDNCLMIIL
jgi:apolipoprotein N-acyltransferase